MKKHTLTFLLAIICSSLVWAQKSKIKPSTIVVRVKEEGLYKSSNAIHFQLNNTLSSFNADAEPMFPKLPSLKNGEKPHAIQNIYKVNLKDASLHASCLTHLNKLPYIVYAEPYYIPHLLDTVNDPLMLNQYHIPLTKIIEAHEIEQGDTNIVIGIIDTGIDMDHEDLVNSIKINYADPINGIDDDQDGYTDNYRGWDVANNDPNPECTDSTYHGALVSGIASATTNNGIGIASPGYGCKFLPIKAANNFGSLTAPYEGVVYAADHGCQIINCSWGDTVKSLFAQDVIDYAVNYRGCVVVAAAGNAKNDTPYYPASLDGVISVGGTGRTDIKWEGSTFGIELDLVAPGMDIYTTGYNNTYRNASRGTSYAAPLVAGVAALLMAHEPQLNARQIAEKIRVNTDVVDTIYENKYYHRLLGSGRLNAYKALSDSVLPGLRITRHDFTSSTSNLIEAGSTGEFNINILNYLKRANSASVLYSDNSEYTTVINDLHRLGDINTLDSANNDGEPFTISIHEDMPYDHEFIATYDMAGAGFSDYQQFKVIANRSFYNVLPNAIKTTFTSNGNLGYANRDRRLGEGFTYNNMQLLNIGGAICGNSINEMVSSMDQALGFNIHQVIDTIQYSDSTIGTASYSPVKEKWDIDLFINQHYHAFTETNHEATIYSTYQIINNSENLLNDYRFSLFTDWDIYFSEANNAAYDESLNMIYTYSYSSTVAYAAICLLNDVNITPYCFDLIEGGNGGIDITDGFSDGEKWFAMNNAREASGNDSYNMDVATMLTGGPFEFAPNDTLELTFALIAADNFEDLKQKARAARLKYTPPSTGVSEYASLVEIYPNPAKDKITLSVKNATAESMILFNTQGKKVNEVWHKNEIKTNDLPDGIYFLQLQIGDNEVTKKVIISH